MIGVVPADQSVVDSIAELDERTRYLLERLQDTSERQDDEIGKLRGGLDRLHQDLTFHVEALQDSDRQVATSGIRLEAGGLFLIAVGVVLQGVGALLT